MDPTAQIVLEHGDARVPTLVYVPEGDGPRPAVVISPEAFGINTFTRKVASDLAEAGHVVVVPDYYRGHGLADPESYTEFTEVMQFIDDLDFVGATHDIIAAVDHARSMPEVDASRVVLWGYCTGSTLVMLGAALDRRLAAAVAFFPSQPTFPELTPKRPVHPIDLLWNVQCPFLLIYGDQDPYVGTFEEIARRFDQWGVEHEVRIYPGAGHAFSAPVAPLRNDAADHASWADALAFLARHL
jgi:carboxymethylenebutenolidase